MDRSDWLFGGGLVTLIVTLIGLAVWGCIHDARAWAAFSAQHHCHIVSISEARSAPAIGVGAKGQTVITTTLIDGQTGFMCDDGVIYYRNN